MAIVNKSSSFFHSVRQHSGLLGDSQGGEIKVESDLCHDGGDFLSHGFLDLP